MNKRQVIFVALDQPLNGHHRLLEKMAGAERRADRQKDITPHLDLPAIQRKVHENILKLHLLLDGHYMDLLDLMNHVKNGGRIPTLTPENVEHFYSLAHAVSHNGIYIYQVLRRAGYDPVIVQNYSLTHLPDILRENPLALCISSNFIFMDEIRDMAAQVKAHDPRIPVIAGGMLVKKVLHAGANLSAPALENLSTFRGKVDAFVVEAQGEQTLLHLLRTLEGDGDLSRVANLAFFDDSGKVQFTGREAESLHMDDTAIEWDRIPEAYLRKTLPVNSSRGCYYRCRFCTYHWLFPEVSYKSLDVLRDELRKIQALGFVRHVRFTDDNFTANQTRLKAVLHMMMEEGFDFTWSSFARASALNPELVRLMKASGCEFVDMGIESGSQTILDHMDKRLARDQSLQAIRLLNDHGIYGRGSFIVGYPGETEETFMETIDLINSSRLPYYHPYLFYYSKNTLIHGDRERFGLRGLGLAWRHSTMDAVEASGLMTRMIRLIDRGYTDGQSYIEEIYKCLRGEGYSPEDILELFRLKRALQLALENGQQGERPSPRVERILDQLSRIVR